jgi:predicted alpha/beta-fold hydrolase
MTWAVTVAAVGVAVVWLWWNVLSKVRAAVHCSPVMSSLVGKIVRRCAVLCGAWRPIPWLPGGIAQTIAVAKLRPRPRDRFTRELFPLADSGQVGLDWLHNDSTDGDQPLTSPILVVLHGMNGGSSENYIQLFLRHAQRVFSSSSSSLRCVVMVARGLGGVALTTPRPYNAGSTDDIRQVVLALRQRYPDAPLLAAGFSLGANVLTRYLGEEGDQCPVCAAVVVSNPLDLAESTRHLESSWVGKRLSAQMAAGLVRFTKKNAEMLARAPTKPDIAAALRAKLCRDYDEAATCKMFGFPNAIAYYSHFSSLPLVSAIRVPTLLLGASDDPMSGAELLELAVQEARKSPSVVVAISPKGGHLGFLEVRPGNPSSLFKATDSWADRATVEFLRVALEETTAAMAK